MPFNVYGVLKVTHKKTRSFGCYEQEVHAVNRVTELERDQQRGAWQTIAAWRTERVPVDPDEGGEG